MEKKKKLRVSVSLSIVFFMTVLAVCLGIIGYSTYYNQMIKEYRKYECSILNLAVSDFDWDSIEETVKKQVEDENFKKLRERLDYIKRNTQIAWLYMFEPLNANETDNQRYICTGNTPKEYEDYAARGEKPVWLGKMNGSETPSDVAQKYLDYYKNSKPGEFLYYPNKTEWGYIYTTAIVVRSSKGNPIGLMCVDIYMEEIEKLLRIFPIIVFGTSIILSAIFILILTLWLNHRVIKPLSKLKLSAEEFVKSSHGNTEPDTLVFSNPEIHTGDEIEILSDSLVTMAGDLKSYMKNLMYETAEKERIGTELSVATNIQASMLPIIFPPFPERKEFDIFASMTPAKEVGGDFYDFFMVDERHLAIVVADVSGKGVPAALFMVIGKTLIKDHTLPGADLGEVFTTVNRMLCEANGAGLFITAFEGVLDLATGEFRYVNAGHESPYILHNGKFTEKKIPAAFILAGMEGMKYKSASITLEPGDKIFQYTDGVTEATNAELKLFGDERLDKSLNTLTDKDVKGVVIGVKADIDKFVDTAPQFDDITMLCLEYKARMEE